METSMLRRKIYDRLLKWKNKPAKKPLLVKGARQVGKTFIIREFAKTYDSYVELNFLKNPEYCRIFEGAIDADSIYSRLTLMVRNVKLIPGKTIVFLDEIQKCGAARTSLKFLAEDGRYDIIASGSLLGIQQNEVASIPVGYEETLVMHSLDLEEFLWAKNYSEDQIGIVRDAFAKRMKVDDFANARFHEETRDYIAIGGMPEVVAAFAARRDYGEADEIQRRIIGDYMDDIMNYAPDAEKPKVRSCFMSIPRQLARESENRKFKYAEVERGVGARKYGNSVEWLRDAEIAEMAYNLSAPLFPLSAYVDDSIFKLYMSDVGLLTAMYGFGTKAAIVGGTIAGTVKGALYENMVASCLIRNGRPLRYLRDRHEPLEVEFMLERGDKVLPVEVKASNSSTASLDRLLSREDIPFGYKLTGGNVGVAGKKITLPHYMAIMI